MKKPKSTDFSQKSPTQPPPRQAAKPKRPIRGKILAALVAGATVLGGAGAVLGLLAHVTVQILPPVQPSKAFSAPFTVTNNSVVTLNHVNLLVGVCRVDMSLSGAFDPRRPRAATIRGDGAPFTSGGETCRGPNGARFYERNWIDQKLLPDDKVTAALDHVLDWLVPQQARDRVFVTSAVITIVVQFQPWIIPWRRESEFRFASQKDSNGILHWSSSSLGDK